MEKKYLVSETTKEERKEIVPKAQEYINEINSINWNNIELEDKALKF